MATDVNVIPQVFQSPRNFPGRSKPETYGWNHILWLHELTLQLQLCIKNWWEMCLQWGVQKDVCGIQGDMQDMWWVPYWTNTTKTKELNGQHLNDMKKLVTKGVKSDSFMSHFAYHCKKGVKPTSDELRKMMKVKIAWQGNAISCMKSFGKLNCSLCMWERIEILHTTCQEEWRIINHCNEIYGSCRHKTRFHRFLKEHTDVKNTSTEGNKSEKVCKYDNQDGFSDLEDSQESSHHLACVTDVTPPPGALDIWCTPILVCVWW
jgi:hypothetical protein